MFKPSLKERILHRIWSIFIPIFSLVAIIWQIVIWDHNVKTSGKAFAIFIILFPCLVLWWYILWMLDKKDPVVWVWEKIQWVIGLFKKK